MAEYENIIACQTGSVAQIILNRPEKLNSLSYGLVQDIGTALDRAETSGARAVLLTANGNGFCSGADLMPPPGCDVKPTEMLAKVFNPFFVRFAEFPLPVVSAINGATAGGGCTLALCSDFAIAARSAYFLQPFTRIGIMPDGGATWMLPRLIGRPRAMQLMMLADKLPAESAYQWGMIHSVVEDDDLADTAMALAQRLAAGPTTAFIHTKKTVALTSNADFATALQAEADAQLIVGATSDCIEGITAFVEKRRPVFQGH